MPPVLTILQVLGAVLRPHPEHRLRPLFAWGHRIGGVSAYLLAVSALLLAQKLSSTKLPDYWFWVVVAAIATHLVVSILLLVSEPHASEHPDGAADAATRRRLVSVLTRRLSPK